MSNLITSRLNDYKDLDLKMKSHPLHGDIRPVVDVDAIKNSIRNIILTKRGERPFNPRFGCNAHEYLFEPADDITKMKMAEEIEYSIGVLEPRVRLDTINMDFDDDRNAFNITLEMTIINSQTQVDVNLTLKRLR